MVYSNCAFVSCGSKIVIRNGATDNVSNRLVSVNVLLHDTVLVDTDSREQIKGALVAGVDTVENQAHDNLLPSWTTLVPKLGLFEVDNVADVLHDTVQGTGSKNLVFVVVGNGNEQLSVTVVHGRTQIVTVLESEVVGVTCRSGVWQLSESGSAEHAKRQMATYIACG